MKTAFRKLSALFIVALMLFLTCLPVYAEAFVPADDICCTCCGNKNTLVFVCTGERAPRAYKDLASIVGDSPFAYVSLDGSAGKCLGMAICSNNYYCRTYSVCTFCGRYQEVTQFHLCGSGGCDLTHFSPEDMQEHLREACDIGNMTLAEFIDRLESRK